MILLCSACGRTQTVIVNTASLNLRSVITFGESTYEGIFKSYENGDCEFSFLVPDSLDGFSLCINEGKLTMNYMGIEHSVPQSDLTESVFLFEITDAFKEIPNKSAIPFTNERIIYEGVTNGRAFTIEFDGQGYPSALEVKSLSLVAKFYKY